MTTYSIEDNIPLPPKGRPRSEERQAMLKLEIGQSFLITEESRAQHARWTAQKIAGRYSVIKGREGWRVWRVA